MTLAQDIRTSTRDLHDAIEVNPFQQKLASGSLSLELYAAYLGQLYLIHKKLEEKLNGYKPLVAWHPQTEFLKDDLDYLGLNPEGIKPVKATVNLLEKIETGGPTSLLGYYYVLFGSKHGAKFLAPNLQSRFKFKDRGTRYFNPYGDGFQGMWKDFIEAVNQQTLPEPQRAEVLEAARTMFQSIGQMSIELIASS